jgi:hypothetical protein
MNTKHKIINGDSRQMSELQDKFLYLCFENEAFINAHLLKVDIEFKYKQKILTI